MMRSSMLALAGDETYDPFLLLLPWQHQGSGAGGTTGRSEGLRSRWSSLRKNAPNTLQTLAGKAEKSSIVAVPGTCMK